MQLGEMLTALGTLLDEDGIRRADATMTSSLNEGYRLIAVLTQACELTHTARLNASTYAYSLPVDFFTAVAVRVDGVRLYPTRLADLDEASPTWLTDATSAPTYYTTTGALSPLPQMWFYPRPTALSTLQMTYAAVPDPMVMDSDIPRLPSGHHYTVLWYAYGWELLKERGAYLANKAYQTFVRFADELNALQSYVYRRTPDRDWVTPPLDAEAVRRKLRNIEQIMRPIATGVEKKDLQE